MCICRLGECFSRLCGSLLSFDVLQHSLALATQDVCYDMDYCQQLTRAGNYRAHLQHCNDCMEYLCQGAGGSIMTWAACGQKGATC